MKGKTEGKMKQVIGGIAIGLAVIMAGGALALAGKALGWYDKKPNGPAPTLEALTFEETVYGTYSVSLKDYTATEVVVPEKYKGKKVTEIGGNELLGSVLLTTITESGSPTPESIKTIVDGFTSEEQASAIENITGGLSGFACGTKLTKVTLPDSIKKISAGAFTGCYALEEVNIPDSVMEIGALAFVGAYALPKIEISNSVTKFGMGAFTLTLGLKEVTFSNNAETLSAGMFMYSGLEKVTLQAGIKKIGADAFANCASLKEIVLPTTLKEIGASAFNGCAALATVYNLSPLEIVAGADTFGGVAKHATNVYKELPKVPSESVSAA